MYVVRYVAGADLMARVEVVRRFVPDVHGRQDHQSKTARSALVFSLGSTKDENGLSGGESHCSCYYRVDLACVLEVQPLFWKGGADDENRLEKFVRQRVASLGSRYFIILRVCFRAF